MSSLWEDLQKQYGKAPEAPPENKASSVTPEVLPALPKDALTWHYTCDACLIKVSKSMTLDKCPKCGDSKYWRVIRQGTVLPEKVPFTFTVPASGTYKVTAKLEYFEPFKFKELKYYRCDDCMTAVASEQPVTACACQGEKDLSNIRFMGVVKRSDSTKWEREEDRPKCNEHCGCAQGPECTCSCGGVNHGLGLTKKVIVDSGVVKIGVVDEKALERAREWREIKRKLDFYKENYLARHEDKMCAAKSNGTYWTLPYHERSLSRRFNYEYSELRSYKAHHAKMKKAREMIAAFGILT